MTCQLYVMFVVVTLMYVLEHVSYMFAIDELS